MCANQVVAGVCYRMLLPPTSVARMRQRRTFCYCIVGPAGNSEGDLGWSWSETGPWRLLPGRTPSKSPRTAQGDTWHRKALSALGDAPHWNAEVILRDYRLGYRSRQCSLVARKEVFGGRAKFGIFGEGKECAQLAMAHAFRKGDFRSGYYRDQTLMFALDLLTPEQFFAQLYAHADVSAEPASGGRAMTSHFATRLLDDTGAFVRQTDRYNSTADVSPTASQMPRLVGLAYASRLYREQAGLSDHGELFSSHGDEIAFGTIGEASCAEGIFWESVNALGVLQAPALISIWDDGFGISVSENLQIAKGDIGRVLEGFGRRVGGRPGIALHVVHGWDYPALCSTYLDAAEQVRRSHAPAVIHVMDLTQPYGHSTSGNHERYKSAERLDWEKEYDCLPKDARVDSRPEDRVGRGARSTGG